MSVAVLCLVIAFALSALLTPVVRSVVIRRGWVDAAGRSHRKVHAHDIPRLGGLAIVLAFFVPITGVAAWRPELLSRLFASDVDLAIAFFLGASAIACLGVYDDVRGSTPRQKVLVQTIVAVALVAAGFGIERLDPPFLRGFELGWLSYPLTVVWIVGVTNAVNLIDGLDGLAAGISLIAILPVAVVALTGGQVVMAVVALTLIGAIGGFLIHNFHPAKIFMGDTGSMFLGFVLAVVTVQVTQKISIVASLAAPMLALALPILDTLTAMARRALLGKPLFSPDREHLHHRLMRLGLTHRGVVVAMYCVGLAFSSLATVVLLYRGAVAGIALILSGLLTAFLLRRLGYFGAHGDVVSAIERGLSVRRRNRALYERLAELKRLAHADAPIDTLAERLLDLVRESGAAWARLALPDVGTLESGKRLSDEPISFAIGGANDDFNGALLCCWPGGTADMVALHVIESAREALEMRLSRAEARLAAAQTA